MPDYLSFVRRHARAHVAIAAALVLALFFVLRSSHTPADYVPVVQSATAIHADVADSASFSGTLEPVREVDIASKSGGQVTALAVDVGSRIGAGAMIAQLDAAQTQATQASLAHDIDAAQTSLSAVDAYYAQQISSAEGSSSVEDAQAQTATLAAITDAAISAKRIDDTLGTIFSMRDGAPASLSAPFAESDLSARDGQAKIFTRSALVDFQHADISFQQLVNGRILADSPSSDDIAAATTQATTVLNAGKRVLSLSYSALSATVSSSGNDALLETYKSSIADLGSQAQAILQRIHDTTTGIAALKKERDAKIAEARAQIVSLEGRRAVTETMLQDGTIQAPFAGVVTQKDIERGAVVAAGTALVHIVDDLQLKLVVGVPDTSGKAYKVGQSATIILDDGRSVSAHVSKVNPAADPVSRKISVELTVSNGARTIAAGSYGRALFSKASAHSIAVPRSAVYTQYDTSSVFVLDGSLVHRRIVQLGAQSDDLIEIAQGISAGETVVTSGVAYLRDGDTVSSQ